MTGAHWEDRRKERAYTPRSGRLAGSRAVEKPRRREIAAERVCRECKAARDEATKEEREQGGESEN